MFRGTLIRSGNNAKTVKGDKTSSYETAIMYLAPADAVAGINLCPMAVMAGCKAGCLFTAGRAATFSSINRARAAKTVRYRDNRAAFIAELVRDLDRFVAYCRKRGVLPAVRLNGTSDIQWEVGHPCSRPGKAPLPGWDDFPSIFDAFPEVQFYDYTKVYKRAYRDLPSNYRLTLSYSEANPAFQQAVTKAAAETGLNYSVVFRSKEARALVMEHNFRGRKVIDGDETDLRFIDPTGVVVGLYAKGRAKQDTTGFVLD